MQKIIDLTHSIEEGMLTFNKPWHSVVSVTQLGRHFLEGRETRQLVIGTHTGTHVDAPLHLISNGDSIDRAPLNKLCGDVSIFDFSHLKPNTAITKEMLKNLKFSERVIFKFGWGKYWNSKKFYSDYPFFSKEAAEYIISKKVSLIGMDTCSPDDGNISLTEGILGTPDDSPIHKLFLGKGIFLVEYLANLDQIHDYNDWSVAILPLKIKGADGSPVRAILFK